MMVRWMLIKPQRSKIQSLCVVAHEILVSAQGPLVLGLGLKGLGLGVWGQGLTIQFWGHTDTQTDTLPFALLELLLRS